MFLADTKPEDRSMRALYPIQCKHYGEEGCCNNPMLFDDPDRSWCEDCAYPVHSTCLELCKGDQCFYCFDCIGEACERAYNVAMEAMVAVEALRAAAAEDRALEEGEAAEQ